MDYTRACHKVGLKPTNNLPNSGYKLWTPQHHFPPAVDAAYAASATMLLMVPCRVREKLTGRSPAAASS